MPTNTLTKTPLGKTTHYASDYDPGLLYPIARALKRQESGILSPLPFHGADLWNAYELSWLNEKGKPVIAMAQFYIPCISPNIVESKSFKLYLNSFNQTRYDHADIVLNLMRSDLSKAFGLAIDINFIFPNDYTRTHFSHFTGTCLDDLDIEVNDYHLKPSLLSTENIQVTEKLYSHLIKSNCLVTGQPDWGSVLIHYAGKKINRESLLRYFISFRHHNEFAEPFVERVFQDILTHCHPEKLSVFACYTRRGGLDINPFRSNFESAPTHFRMHRQ